MALISIAFEWALDQWAVVVAALAFVYNMLFNSQNSRLIASSLTVALMYAFGHFLLAWINELPFDEQVYFRYSSRFLLYAIAGFFMAALIFKLGPNFTTTTVFSIMIFSMIMQLLLHIDRNVIGLNKISESIELGNAIVNKGFPSGYWFLWDFYTVSLNVTGCFLFIYLFVGEDIKEYLCSRFS
jgi:hypothetical protein